MGWAAPGHKNQAGFGTLDGPDVCTAATIRTPLTRPASASRPAEAGQADAVLHALSSDEFVLVVDDEKVVRHVVVEVLNQLGYAVLEAEDADAALAAIESRGNLHMLISDIGLPGMNGRLLAEILRERQPGLKVLLMTGYAADASSATGFPAGMELIAKPFTVNALADRLRRMLGDGSDQDAIDGKA